MNAHPKKSWVLSDKVTQAVQQLMGEGRISSLDEVVQIALGQLLQPPDPEPDEWIEREVVPVIEEMERHPERALSLDQVIASLQEHHAKRLAEG